MTIQATALFALQQASQQVDQAAATIQRATTPTELPQDRVDLSEGAVRLLTARTQFQAAIELAKTADEIAEGALDLLA